MITEIAQVVAVEGEYALVQTQRQSVCGQCAANKGCGTAVLSKVLGQKYSRVRVFNSKSANVGDLVTIGLNEDGLLKSALLVYCVPLIAMVLSVAAIQFFLGNEFNELWAITGGFTGLAVAYLLIRNVTGRVSHAANFQPIMLSVDNSEHAHATRVFVP